MTHPVWFKFLLLLTFAVLIHQCEAFASKITVLNDCCSLGRNKSKSSCNESSYNLNLVPKSLQIECKSKIKYCCRRQRETDDCNEGILAAQNGSSCPRMSSKYMICHKACTVGIKMADRGENCSEPVTDEETFEINARKTCCEQRTKEVLLPEDEETDEAINDEDEYDENDTFFDTSSSSSEVLEETTTTARSTTQSETTQHTTTTEPTTTEASTTETTTTTKSIDYDEASTKFSTTTRYPAKTTTISPEETTTKIESLTTVYSDSLKTNELDTVTTTRRSPPIFRHPTTTNRLFLSASDTISTTRPTSDNMKPYVYQRPKYSDNSSNYQIIYNYYPKYPKSHYHTSNIFHDSTKFRASSLYHGYKPEPCGDIRYCDHNCIVTNNIQKCSCNKGYTLQRDGKTCLKDGSLLPPEEIRIKKRCPHGHFLNDLGECQDIDECRIQNNGCGDQANCRNKIGSYECIPNDICRTGYRYHEISKTCEDINECVENPRICNNGQCNNTVGSYTCEDSYLEFQQRCEESVRTTLPTTRGTTTFRTATTHQRPCPQGFERNYRGVCVDIDECQFNPCDQGLICVNRNGGYTCDVSHCNPGFKPEGRACTDINECDSNPCPVTHNCMNTHGSYVCKMKFCPRGYRLDSFGGCEDIDECKIYKNVCRNADCINTDGSYSCNCNQGFRMDEKKYCRDINECTENIHGCSHQCYNTFGGYQCYCENGFRLNADKKTCDDIDECSESRDLLCRGECENTLGGYECKCPAGFRMEDSYCTDIDECQENLDNCVKKKSRCLNTPGSFKCMDIGCKEDYKLVQRNGEKYCHLRTPCGDDDYDDNCNKPWMYSYSFTSRVANCSASNIFHLSISNQLRYDVVIENVQAKVMKHKVIIAGTDDFEIQRVSSGFFLVTTKPIDGPQEINIDVLVTLYRPDGNVEYKRGIKVQMIVSEFSFYKFSVRK